VTHQHPCQKCGRERHLEWRPNRMKPTYRCWVCIGAAKRGNAPRKKNPHYARGRRKDCAVCGSTELAIIKPRDGGPTYTDFYCRPCRRMKTKEYSLRTVEKNEHLVGEPKPPGKRLCKTCNRELPWVQFSLVLRAKDGHDPKCKQCRAAVRANAWKRFQLKKANNGQAQATEV
jgi:hypothetical protein